MTASWSITYRHRLRVEGVVAQGSPNEARVICEYGHRGLHVRTAWLSGEGLVTFSAPLNTPNELVDACEARLQRLARWTK